MPWIDDADNHDEKLEDVGDGIAKKASEVGEEIVEKEKLNDLVFDNIPFCPKSDDKCEGQS